MAFGSGTQFERLLVSFSVAVAIAAVIAPFASGITETTQGGTALDISEISKVVMTKFPHRPYVTSGSNVQLANRLVDQGVIPTSWISTTATAGRYANSRGITWGLLWNGTNLALDFSGFSDSDCRALVSDLRADQRYSNIIVSDSASSPTSGGVVLSALNAVQFKAALAEHADAQCTNGTNKLTILIR